MKTIEFEAVTSRDLCGFCFDVDKENYKKLIPSKFREKYPDSFVDDNLWKVWVEEIFQKLEIGRNKKIKIKIEVEEI